MQTPNETPLRHFRIPDELWTQVKATTALRKETASDVVRAALAEYVEANRPLLERSRERVR